MSNPYVGEIRLFAGNFAPQGWFFCQGQTLPISEYDVLFNLIGITYGGDGQQTFTRAAPSTSGRAKKQIPISDWGEGRAPFPEDRLPDGGSGGSARVVPDHFGTNWAAEIGNRDVRMKADHVKTTATTEEVSSHPGEKEHCIQKWRRNNSRAGKKPRADWKNGLQIRGAGRKS